MGGVKEGINKDVEINGIDRERIVCAECGSVSFPSYFCLNKGVVGSQANNNKWVHLCKKCLIDIFGYTAEDLRKAHERFKRTKMDFNHLSRSWVSEEANKKLIREFIKIEEEDRRKLFHIDLWKTHLFLEDLKNGYTIYSEEEMMDYFNYYGNNPEIVKFLRKVFHEQPEDTYLSKMYIASRSYTLSDKQIKSLKRNKKFQYEQGNLSDFWDVLDDVLVLVCSSDTSEENSKIKRIVESVLNDGFYTERQEYVVRKFLEDNS